MLNPNILEKNNLFLKKKQIFLINPSEVSNSSALQHLHNYAQVSF